MSVFDWHVFLKNWSQAILNSPDVEYLNLPKKAFKSKWLGFDPAHEEQIVEAEARLGTQLPPSYRAFLKASNGWRSTGTFVDRVLPVEKIYWFRDAKDKSLIQLAQLFTDQMQDTPYDPEIDDVDYEHLLDTLVITRPSEEQELYLLNPQVKNDEDEWQAWVFAHWIPGARPYISFQALLEEEYKTILENTAIFHNHLSVDDDKDTLAQKLDYLITTIQEDIKLATPDDIHSDHPNQIFAKEKVQGMQEVLERIIAIKESDYDAKKIIQELDLLVRHFDGKHRDYIPRAPSLQDMYTVFRTVFENKEITDPKVLNQMEQMLRPRQSGVIAGNMAAIDRLRYLMNG